MRYLKRAVLLLSISSSLFSSAQNDLDALRYSRTDVFGSPRAVALGGAFGALGADVSCASTNPAGLAIYRRGEMIYAGGLRFTNNYSKFENKTSYAPNGNFAFSSFGMAFSNTNEKDATKRTTFCFSNNQLQNFNEEIILSNGSTRSSIAGDMLTLANDKKILNQMNPSYELLGYNSYLLDYDSLNNKFFTFMDLKRNHSLTRSISSSGRMNEINFSLSQAVDDKYYIGVSLGIPRVKYDYTMVHSEVDANDSMKVTLTSASTYSTTYLDELPFIYPQFLGFNSVAYTEYFRTTGYGLNLKIGGLLRVNSNFRFGGYIHTPTILYLNDIYSYSITTTFDSNTSNKLSAAYPDNMGTYEYKIITPMKYGFNGAFIFNKMGAVGLDIESINYGRASISSSTPTDFDGVNAVIKNKYKTATNIRIGGELNIKPVMLRAGYAMNSSPFGGLFKGPFDRQTISFGAGLRTKSNLFFDVVWARTFTKEQYYIFSSAPIKSDLELRNTRFMVSVGLKF
ncbi:MAG: hypothetical protein ACK50A_16890 [Sphingobacteriaceae bacterium]